MIRFPKQIQRVVIEVTVIGSRIIINASYHKFFTSNRVKQFVALDFNGIQGCYWCCWCKWKEGIGEWQGKNCQESERRRAGQRFHFGVVVVVAAAADCSWCTGSNAAGMNTRIQSILFARLVVATIRFLINLEHMRLSALLVFFWTPWQGQVSQKRTEMWVDFFFVAYCTPLKNGAIFHA